jgi:hypothetical protein
LACRFRLRTRRQVRRRTRPRATDKEKVARVEEEARADEVREVHGVTGHVEGTAVEGEREKDAVRVAGGGETAAGGEAAGDEASSIRIPVTPPRRVPPIRSVTSIAWRRAPRLRSRPLCE